MKEIYDILKSLWLTGQEIKIYLSLLELQEARTGLLCNRTGISNSHIYGILNKLLTKGLVNYRMQNNVKIFMAAPPDTLIDLFSKKQQKLEEQKMILEKEKKQIIELISILKKKPIVKEPYSNYKYYEGIAGIKALRHEINTVMRQNSVIKAYTCKIKSYERFKAIYKEHERQRKLKNVKELLIFPEAERGRKQKKLTKYRIMPLGNDAEWGIVQDSFFIQYIIGKNPRGFLIKDPIIAQSFEQVFNQLWEAAERS